MTAPRTPQERVRDTLDRLEHDVDAWIATCGDGTPHMVPLSFLWDSATLLVATSRSSRTGRNLLATGEVRVGIGPTRDLVLIEGTALPADDVPGDEFVAKTGFDPRLLPGYQYFRIHLTRVQAWRAVDELPGRDLMRDGRWLTSAGDHADGTTTNLPVAAPFSMSACAVAISSSE